MLHRRLSARHAGRVGAGFRQFIDRLAGDSKQTAQRPQGKCKLKTKPLPYSLFVLSDTLGARPFLDRQLYELTINGSVIGGKPT